jgi:hypothetical protein
MSQVHTFHPTEIRLPGFDAAWAGEIPGKDGFCFGSTDGRLWFTQISTPIPGAKPIKVASSGESVTGVAFWDNFMAVSTPNEIVIQYHNHDKKEAKEATIEVGAHEILATRSGRFLAPIGIGGLLEIKPDPNVNAFPNLHAPKGRVLNFYSAVLFPGDCTEVIACATRRDGITLVTLPQEESGGKVRVIPCEGVDVVDVCALNHPNWPLAVAAIGLDCSVFLMKNALEGVGLLALRFVGMKGNAYRILSAGGNLFVLTSEFLYVLSGLGRRYLQEDDLGGATPVRAIPLRAVDFFLAYDRWLLIIMPGYVLSVDIHSFLDETLQISIVHNIKSYLRKIYSREGPWDKVLEEEVIATTTRPETNFEDFSITSDQMTVST